MTTARRSNRRVFLAPYHLRVSAARDIARALGASRILPENSRYRGRTSDLVVNWGRSELPLTVMVGRVLNRPAAVQIAVNKRLTFEAFRTMGVPTVDWTDNWTEASQWYRDGEIVVQRALLTSRGGDGIRLCIPGQTEAPNHDARLYTKYAKRRDEYRVHVFGGQIIDVQEKRRRRGAERSRETSMIRSYDNGWVFCRSDVTAPLCVLEAAEAAVGACALDFGAVDVGYNEHYRRAYVYEVNTAPGCEGSTVDAYVNKIKELVA